MQLAEHSGRKLGFSCPAPIAPGSLAAKRTASVCSAGSASLSLGPKTRIAPCRPPWQTQAQLRHSLLDSSERVSKRLSRTAGLPPHCRRDRKSVVLGKRGHIG